METNRVDSFFAFERKHNVFSMVDELGDFYWDAIRHYVFSAFAQEVPFDTYVSYRSLSLKRITNSIKRFIQFAWGVVSKRHKYIVLLCSRGIASDGRRYDQIAEDLLRTIERNALLIETQRSDLPSKYYNSFPSFFHIYFRLACFFFGKPKIDSALAQHLKDEMGIDIQSDQIVEMVNWFRFQSRYYKLLFKVVKPRAIFLSQNGSQKGLFKAGRELGIPIIELQHGVVGRGHGAYSYDQIIQADNSAIYMPDYIFRLSDYWFSNFHCPVRGFVTTGNSHFAKPRLADNQVGDALTVVSANVYGENLKDLTRSFAVRNPTVRIFFKLHPNEFEKESNYRRFFEEVSNVEVVTSGIPLNQLLMISRGILLIHSTVAYEALDLHRNVFVYKRQLYHDHEDIFSIAGVHLIDSCRDLEESWKVIPEKRENNFRFFQPYDQGQMEDFLKNILKSEEEVF